MNTENISIKDIDYKELAQECKTQGDLASLTKQFMKNMIENMLKAEIDEYVVTPENDVATLIHTKDI